MYLRLVSLLERRVVASRYHCIVFTLSLQQLHYPIDNQVAIQANAVAVFPENDQSSDKQSAAVNKIQWRLTQDLL